MGDQDAEMSDAKNQFLHCYSPRTVNLSTLLPKCAHVNKPKVERTTWGSQRSRWQPDQGQSLWAQAAGSPAGWTLELTCPHFGLGACYGHMVSGSSSRKFRKQNGP
eukprot:10766727-Karenia_brevis.AAC.1